jgi:hypothetical protein
VRKKTKEEQFFNTDTELAINVFFHFRVEGGDKQQQQRNNPTELRISIVQGVGRRGNIRAMELLALKNLMKLYGWLPAWND